MEIIPMPNSDPVIQSVVNQNNYQKNLPYTNGDTDYQTQLSPIQEVGFQQWLKDKDVPFQDGPTSDYDMRGFYLGTIDESPNVKTGINKNDGKLHYTDYYKTPYHESFSAESKFADKDKAPSWNKKDQLVTPGGKVVFDEPKMNRNKTDPVAIVFGDDVANSQGDDSGQTNSQ